MVKRPTQIEEKVVNFPVTKNGENTFPEVTEEEALTAIHTFS